MTVDIRRAPYAGWRALAATVLVMAGAVGAHTWAGGHVPDGSVLIALTALVLGGSLLVLRGTMPAVALLPVIAAAQAGRHTSFALSATDHAGHLDHAEAAAAGSEHAAGPAAGRDRRTSRRRPRPRRPAALGRPGPGQRAVTSTDAGTWTADVLLPRAGTWEVAVGLRVSRFENPVTTVRFEVAEAD